ncbi:Structural maintenance of chromosomes flexible hinge domain-containing protein 1 [Bulinus truncatus]|nr:Structural maintenance of chromosomes flexible hinge domain-containing protein 1 [Bulinus truncatus]
MHSVEGTVDMISKPKDSTDVHELIISKEEFENVKRITSPSTQVILGTGSPNKYILAWRFIPYKSRDENLIKMISEEPERSSFTAVIIQGVNTQHGKAPQAENFKCGPDSEYEYTCHPNPKSIDLRKVNDDHAVLVLDAEPEDDHGYAINERPARGRRPIFETYWNGRLIPYTVIEDFDWCSLPKRQKIIPAECYNSMKYLCLISGVLWTNDSFQVSTNKLTFMDLEMKLKDKNTNPLSG